MSINHTRARAIATTAAADERALVTFVLGSVLLLGLVLLSPWAVWLHVT